MAKGKSMIWYNGGTCGFRIFIAWDPPEGADGIGRNLLDEELPLATFDQKDEPPFQSI